VSSLQKPRFDPVHRKRDLMARPVRELPNEKASGKGGALRFRARLRTRRIVLSDGTPGKAGDTARYWHNNAGELFRSLTTEETSIMPDSINFEISVSQVKERNLKAGKKGLRAAEKKQEIASCECTLYSERKKKIIYIGSTSKNEAMLRLGQPKDESKDRFLFRIFFEEVLRAAREKGVSAITIDTQYEGFKKYLAKNFGFRFSKNVGKTMTNFSGRLPLPKQD
jgi:hypothetical protein